MLSIHHGTHNLVIFIHKKYNLQSKTIFTLFQVKSGHTDKKINHIKSRLVINGRDREQYKTRGV